MSFYDVTQQHIRSIYLQTCMDLFPNLTCFACYLATPSELASTPLFNSRHMSTEASITTKQRASIDTFRVFITISPFCAQATFFLICITIGWGILEICEILIGQWFKPPVFRQKGNPRPNFLQFDFRCTIELFLELHSNCLK